MIYRVAALDGALAPATSSAVVQWRWPRRGIVSEVFIANAEPWNRLVDVQLAGGKPVRFSVPAEMYLDCAKAISRRFGNSVSADREYDIDFPGKYRLLTGPRQGKPVQSPGLVIRARR